MTARELTLKGVVQGVGFRPFVYRLAVGEKLRGYVTNTAGSVKIHIEGSPEAIESFKNKLLTCIPRGAVVTEFEETERAPAGYPDFRIVESTEEDTPLFTIPADMAVCEACVKELFDPADRRYRYPFINCTDCGPRFTIVEGVPYDRDKTSMKHFEMCPSCREEYENPLSRRYHAEPNACPVCGPKLVLLDSSGAEISCPDPIEEARKLLLEGKIVAVKGLGGFQLAADATNEDAVSLLRKRKRRSDKPFAVMVENLDAASKICDVPDDAKETLLSKEAPILLLDGKRPSPLAPSVAPGLDKVGIFLPYTPLHRLLLEGLGRPLVMTSGNISDEPIAIGNEEALQRLAGLADAFLIHDREIVQRSDDSVVSTILGSPYPIRRARGYAPTPVVLDDEVPETVGLGGELKCTLTVTKSRFAYVSQHIGDMEHPLSRNFHEEVLTFFTNFLDSSPEAVCRDLHPGYHTSREAENLAKKIGATKIFPLQHHRAHIYSLIAESGFAGAGVGVALDGTGYGEDGAIWGGEFFAVDGLSLKRIASFRYFPLQGGDSTIKEPWKTGLSMLFETFGEKRALTLAKKIFPHVPADDLELVLQAITEKLNCVDSSSCGRIFDAASAISGTCAVATYEGQAAMTFQALIKRASWQENPYPWMLEEKAGMMLIDVRPLFESLTRDALTGVDPARMAVRFHLAMAELIASVSMKILKWVGGDTVLLSGGVFQNENLVHLVVEKILENGYKVILHRKVPPNDGGISLGQAYYAAKKLTGRIE